MKAVSAAVLIVCASLPALAAPNAPEAAAFAEALRARVAATAVAPATQQTQAEIDEYLRRARERGRAPPPVTRRQ